jgi:hypothetical protein
LGFAGAIGYQRQQQPQSLESVDDLMRVGKQLRVLVAIGRVAIGEMPRDLDGRHGVTGLGEGRERARRDFPACGSQLEPPASMPVGVGPEMRANAPAASATWTGDKGCSSAASSSQTTRHAASARSCA